MTSRKADLIVDGVQLRDSLFIKTVEVSRSSPECDAPFGAAPCNAPCDTTFRCQSMQPASAPLCSFRILALPYTPIIAPTRRLRTPVTSKKAACAEQAAARYMHGCRSDLAYCLWMCMCMFQHVDQKLILHMVCGAGARLLDTSAQHRLRTFRCRRAQRHHARVCSRHMYVHVHVCTCACICACACITSPVSYEQLLSQRQSTQFGCIRWVSALLATVTWPTVVAASLRRAKAAPFQW